ncbi:MAG: hypothetical protein J6P34_02670 [Paludibacteraceae bacterium]|nr:hypothetical protein [Paludibacteraceae bacterium]
MKKIYLLITTALLLIGSGTMWADDCTSADAKAVYECYGPYMDGNICNWADITNVMLNWSAETSYMYNYLTLTINEQNASFEVSDNASGECISNLEQKNLKNKASSTVVVKNKTNVIVNSLTNNFGIVYDNGDWIGGVQLNGYTGGSVTNNAHLYLYSGGIKGGCLVQNNSTGTVTVAGGVSASSTSQSATIANDGGTVNCTSGRFYPGATLTNNQGTVNFTGSCDITNGVQIVNNGGVINISGSSFKASNVFPNLSDKIAEILNNGGTINISDGTFDECNIINKEGTTGTIRVSGGKFKDEVYEQIKDFILPGYNVEITSGGYHQVVAEVVARVNGDAYTNVWKAIKASSNVDAAHHAVLQMDATVNFEEMLGSNLNYVLDLNGHNLLATGTLHMLLNCVQHGPQSFSIINSDPTKGGVITASDPYNQGILFYIAGVTDASAENFSVLNIGEGVTIQCASDINYGVAIMPCSDNKGYGVVVNIDGKLLLENGTCTYIHGTVKATEGNVPQININNGAVLGNVGSKCTASACIYAAGYGIWNIGAATLKANTPIYAKAGQVTINGATIEACGAYADPQPYGSGYYPTGDAIIFDSKNGYSGNMQLTIADATITSANGYAVQEVLTDREESQTLSMTINGGKFKGEKGTIVVSEKFDVSTPTRWANNSIKSGKYTSAPNDVADGYVVALNTDDDKAEYPYVVVADNTYPGVVTEITTNTTETSVVEIAENHGILVKSGVTYEVKGISFTGANTRITVEPGATLIVGESGFIGSDAGRLLVLEADKANGTAKLKFNGTTEAASHVYAKVEQYMYAKALGSDTYVWQHIGSPMQTDQLNKISKTDPYLFNAWNVSGSWKYVDPSEVTSAWVGYNSTTNRTTEGSKLTYEGSLEGNSPAQFTFEPNGYNCFANSYVSALSIKETLGALSTSGVQTDGMIWIYDAALGKKWIQRNVEYYTIFGNDDEGIAPMQAFFLLNNSSNASSFTVSDYKTAVYDFNGETPVLKGAPDVNAGIITLTSGDESATLQIIEGDQYSDEFGPGDGYQMATDMVQIYVLQGESKLSAIATNSLKDKEIVIVTKANTSCTLSFSNLIGNAFKLTDIVTGAEIEVGADKTYTFTAEANSTIKRFKLGEGEVSADEADANNVNVWVANNSMNIAGATEGDAIEVINLAGIKVLSATATGEAVQTIPLSGIASGAYIVKAGAATVKVIK